MDPKRRNSPYRSGRQETWLKLKCTKSDTFPIVAFVEKLGARPRKIPSLYVGRREGNRLVYASKARSGYTEQVAREVRERLDPLIIRKTPLSVPVKKPKATCRFAPKGATPRPWIGQCSLTKSADRL